jgi:hypothetical protein
MTKQIKNTVIGLGLFIFIAAAPAGATVINIGVPAGDTFGVTGTTVNTFATPISVTTINGAGTGLTLTLAYNASTDVMVLQATGTGTGAYSNITGATNLALLTFDFSGPLALNTAKTSLVVPSTSSVVANTTFLGDLGIGAGLANAMEINTLAMNGSVAGSTFTESSTTFLVTTPEPVTFLLLGSGLGLVGFLGRKKRFGLKP